MLRVPAVPADVTNEATDGFGILKATLGVVSAAYTDHGVCLRPPVQNSPLTGPFAGNRRRQKQDRGSPLTDNHTRDTFCDTSG